MMVAHLGVAAFAFGVAMVKTYEAERDVKMSRRRHHRAGRLPVQDGVGAGDQGLNYVAAQGGIEVSRDGKLIAAEPEKRLYKVQGMPMTEAAVDSNLLRDLYVSMGEQLPNNDWIVRARAKPFINWIWIGCLMMMLGGTLAASDAALSPRRTARICPRAGRGCGRCRMRARLLWPLGIFLGLVVFRPSA